MAYPVSTDLIYTAENLSKISTNESVVNNQAKNLCESFSKEIDFVYRRLLSKILQAQIMLNVI